MGSSIPYQIGRILRPNPGIAESDRARMALEDAARRSHPLSGIADSFLAGYRSDTEPAGPTLNEISRPEPPTMALARAAGPQAPVRPSSALAAAAGGPGPAETAPAAPSALRRAAMPESIRAGEFEGGPEWGGSIGPGGSSLRSAAQMEQDLRAHALIDAGHEQAMGAIEREGQRNNPTRRRIQAESETAALEQLLPVGPSGRPRSSLYMEANGPEGRIVSEGGMTDIPERFGSSIAREASRQESLGRAGLNVQDERQRRITDAQAQIDQDTADAINELRAKPGYKMLPPEQRQAREDQKRAIGENRKRQLLQVFGLSIGETPAGLFKRDEDVLGAGGLPPG